MAVRAFIKRFNKKLYDSNDLNETNWSRWYFPLINTDKSLKELDTYMQDCLHYTASETHTKARYNYRYEQMKALGYRNLVNEWTAANTPRRCMAFWRTKSVSSVQSVEKTEFII